MAEAMDDQSAETSSKSKTESKPMTYSEKQWLHVKKMAPENRMRLWNKRLHKMLLPKNSVAALNELLREGGDKVASFTVTPCSQFANNPLFCATLTVNGHTVEGYGESKIMSKKSAAEKALKAIYFERLTQYMKMENEKKLRRENRKRKREQSLNAREQTIEEETTEADAVEGDAAAGSSAEAEDIAEPQEPEPPKEERVTLPMMQLASFALFKLFTSWEMEGYILPYFNKLTAPKAPGAGSKPRPQKPKAAKRQMLPLNASTLSPGFLLHRMVDDVEYKELAIEANKLQRLTFVVSVNAKGKSYVGRGHSKKEARRQAAIAACSDLYQVVFQPNADSIYPIWPEETSRPT